jgi:hypothetical protein
MKKKDACSGCSQKDTCRQAYEKIGKADGPNVAPTAIVAFLVPIAVFIGTAALSQHLLKERFEGVSLTLISFFLALSVTVAVVYAIRGIRGLLKKLNMTDES